MTRDQVFSIFFLAFLAFILYHIFRVFTPFLSTAFWAFLVVFAAFPLYELIEKRLGLHRNLAALLMTVLIFAILVIPMIALILYLSDEAVNLYLIVKKFVATGSWHQFVDYLKRTPLADYLAKQDPQWNSVINEGLTNFLLDSSKRMGNFFASHLTVLTKNLVLFFFNFLLFICFVFFFFRSGRDIFQFLYEMVPMPAENKTVVVTALNNTFTAIIRGQFLTSLVQGVLAGIVFWFLGIPLFILFGLITFFTSMIPVLGAASVWVPIAAYLLIVGEIQKGIILILCGTFGISLVDNFLKAALIGGHSRISAVLIFLGIIGGIAAYGISGIFIGPIVLAVFFVLIKIFRQQYIA